MRRARQALTGPRGWGAHSVDGVCGLGAGGESSPAPSPNGHIRLTSRALGPASRGQPDAGHASRSPLVRPRHAAPCSSCRVRVRGGGGSTPLDTALLCVVILPLYVLFFRPTALFTVFVVSFDKINIHRRWHKQCASGTTGRCVSSESSRVAQAPLPLARAPLATLAPPCLPSAQSPSSPPFALLSGSCTSASCPSACPPPAPAQVVPISALTIDETLCGGDEIYRCSPPPP